MPSGSSSSSWCARPRRWTAAQVREWAKAQPELTAFAGELPFEEKGIDGAKLMGLRIAELVDALEMKKAKVVRRYKLLMAMRNTLSHYPLAFHIRAAFSRAPVLEVRR